MIQIGQVLEGRYRIDKLLGGGGFGCVFQAQHVGTELTVAVKVLADEVSGLAHVREMFALEARVSARIRNKHIVKVLDAGLDATHGCAYIVMELLAGETLGARVARGPLSPADTFQVLQQVAVGLDAAHGYRNAASVLEPIVHRDLKPENLFLAQEDGREILKILDFGIAKVVSASVQRSIDVRGTPPFMAYEQVNAEDVSPQTDIWALGLIAHYLLFGCHYWRKIDKPGVAPTALLAEILTSKLDAPSLRLRERNLAVQLPAGFDGWLLRCIDRNPAARFPSAGVAVEALVQAFAELSPEQLQAPLHVAPAAAVPATKTFFRSPVASPKPSGSGSLASVTGSREQGQGSRFSKWARVGVAAGAGLGLLLLWWWKPRSDESFLGGRDGAPSAVTRPLEVSPLGQGGAAAVPDTVPGETVAPGQLGSSVEEPGSNAKPSMTERGQAGGAATADTVPASVGAAGAPSRPHRTESKPRPGTSKPATTGSDSTQPAPPNNTGNSPHLEPALPFGGDRGGAQPSNAPPLIPPGDGLKREQGIK